MRKGERTRLEIIERARRLFMEKGFSGTSMSDICASLSLSRGGLYRHFSCLEEVFIACLKDDAEIWEQELDRVLGLGLDSRLILNRYLEVKEAEIQEGSGRITRAHRKGESFYRTKSSYFRVIENFELSRRLKNLRGSAPRQGTSLRGFLQSRRI